jgi:TetR/AcrR family transcriptional regulator
VQVPRSSPGSEATRRRISAAAAEVFAEHGFAGAGVDEIARRAGVNKAMLYYHVGDKAALYASVLMEHMGKVLAGVSEAIAASDDPRVRLRAIQGVFARVFKQAPHFPKLMLREIAADGANLPPEGLQTMARVFGMTREVVDDGRRRGVFRDVNPLLTHVLVVGSMVFLVRILNMLDRFDEAGLLPADLPTDFESLADPLTDMILNGIAEPHGGNR